VQWTQLRLVPGLRITGSLLPLPLRTLMAWTGTGLRGHCADEGVV
jgi:hypothetical protein